MMYGDERYRKLTAAAKRSSLRSGNKRMAQENRRCPVPGCSGKPKDYSRYCPGHATKLKHHGHPVISLRINNRHKYEQALKVGRWVRQALTENQSDHRAWLRVEAEIARIGTDPRYASGVLHMSRNDRFLKNSLKARCLISRKLSTNADAEELLAAFLGLAGSILAQNDVPMNAKQLRHCFHKAGGRAINRYLIGLAKDPETQTQYKWHPGFGVLTRAGEVIDDAISREFGGYWFKQAEQKLVVGLGGNPENVDALKPGVSAEEFKAALDGPATSATTKRDEEKRGVSHGIQ